MIDSVSIVVSVVTLSSNPGFTFQFLSWSFWISEFCLIALHFSSKLYDKIWNRKPGLSSRLALWSEPT